MKNILYIFLFTTILLSQEEFASKIFKYFKINDFKSVDILNLINEKQGVYKVEILTLDNLDYKRYKKTMNPFTCELEFVIDSNISKPVNISLCKNEMIVGGYLLVDKENPVITIEHEKFPFFEGTITMIISGVFSNNYIRTSEKNNNGILKEWYDNGNLYLEFQMKNGIKNGICKKWFDDGSSMITYNYINGKLNGTQKKWYQNGNQKAEWNYIDDIQHGFSKEWHENGLVKSLKKYFNGKLLEELQYDLNGNKV